MNYMAEKKIKLYLCDEAKEMALLRLQALLQPVFNSAKSLSGIFELEPSETVNLPTTSKKDNAGPTANPIEKIQDTLLKGRIQYGISTENLLGDQNERTLRIKIKVAEATQTAETEGQTHEVNNKPKNKHKVNHKGIEVTPSPVCIFCQLDVDDEFKYGKIHRLGNVTVHYYCMLFSSALEQRGTDEEGILGFLPADIKREVKRGRKLKCIHCKRGGATIGCSRPKCKKQYHFPCGLINGTMHQYFENYNSYCRDHRPRQKHREADSRDSEDCPICFDSIVPKVSNDTLHTPCCRHNRNHRDCVQRLAFSAGYFFKCPFCNNVKEFKAEMEMYGIHIPEQDASWELEPNAYQELLVRPNSCDAEPCICPKGRTHRTDIGQWELIYCEVCGSQACHIGCGKLKVHDPRWMCPECDETLHPPPVTKKKGKFRGSKRRGRKRKASSILRQSLEGESYPQVSNNVDRDDSDNESLRPPPSEKAMSTTSSYDTVQPKSPGDNSDIDIETVEDEAPNLLLTVSTMADEDVAVDVDNVRVKQEPQDYSDDDSDVVIIGPPDDNATGNRSFACGSSTRSSKEISTPQNYQQGEGSSSSYSRNNQLSTIAEPGERGRTFRIGNRKSTPRKKVDPWSEGHRIVANELLQNLKILARKTRSQSITPKKAEEFKKKSSRSSTPEKMYSSKMHQRSILSYFKKALPIDTGASSNSPLKKINDNTSLSSDNKTTTPVIMSTSTPMKLRRKRGVDGRSLEGKCERPKRRRESKENDKDRKDFGSVTSSFLSSYKYH